jgi:SRSO17 transposase
MTEQQLQELGPALADFLDQFLFCCGYTQTFEHLKVYCRGLLSDLPRKSVEPIACAAGTPVRTLQEFLKDHDWRQDQVRQLLQQHVARRLPQLPHAPLGVIGLVDETGTPKKGTKTPGVQRQWCGRLGKVDNCLVTVHLGICHGRYKTLLDEDLYLPQEWAQDRKRCQQAGIPDTVLYRPKWQIALEQIDRAVGNGVTFAWLTFDEEYGKRPGFVQGLDGRKLRFVGEVPKTLSCLPVNRSGRRPAAAVAGQVAEEVVRHHPAFRSQSWQPVRLERQTLAAQHWRVKATQVWVVQDEHWSERSYWLIWAVNEASGEEKYFLSNASAQTPVATLLRVGFCRWNVEHEFRVGKSELGFGHYEGRNYVGLQRHLVLCLLMLTFVSDQTVRLRGEKSGGDDGAGLPGAAVPQRRVAGGPAGDEPVGVHAADHPVSPETEPSGSVIPAEEAAETCRPSHRAAVAA